LIDGAFTANFSPLEELPWPFDEVSSGIAGILKRAQHSNSQDAMRLNPI
jgi:hypothetical protein